MAGIKKKERVWEVDFLRGLLIFGMIYIHVVFDLEYIFGMNVDYDGGVCGFLVKIVGPLFIIVSGISTAFSRNSFKRGLLVFSISLLITLSTYIYNRDFVIIFGILHFIGICMMVSPLFKKLPTIWLFVLSAIFASTNLFLPHIKATHNYLFMFGIHNSNFISSDYYPLLPYMWEFLFGMGLSRILYKEKKSIFPFALKSSFVNFVGKNSLYFYLGHQPVILAVITLVLQIIKH